MKRFPQKRGPSSIFPAPDPDEVVEINPPSLQWVAEPEVTNYRVVVTDAAGKTVADEMADRNIFRFRRLIQLARVVFVPLDYRFMTIVHFPPFVSPRSAIFYHNSVFLSLHRVSLLSHQFYPSPLSVIPGLYGIVAVALITSIIVNFYDETKDKDNDE